MTPSVPAAADAALVPPRWQFWIDRGGTFTDIVARRPDGTLVTRKLLSADPARYRDAAVAGIRDLLGLQQDAPISPQRVECVKMGTTVATNALLERRGAPVVLVTTRGFRDALRIAYQDRPRLFDRHIVLPELLYRHVIEVDERLDAQGGVVQPLDGASLSAQLCDARAAGYDSVAIVFLHGWCNGAHEQAAAELARAAGYAQVSVSHRVSPLIKFVGRGDTTVVDAYLSPLLRRYVDQVATEMPGVPLYFMQSSGGLADAAAFHGKDAVLSGPAGGIVGMARTAEHALAAEAPVDAPEPVRLIGFDMGGTSTDVSHYAGEFERAFDTRVAGVRMRAPMMSIHTVAAGGGSILRFDGARLRVGPESAGADPGPACYRHGGPLTVTDANLLLGKLRPEHFPQVFGPEGHAPLDAAVVAQRFAALADEVAHATGTRTTPESLAEGAIDIAVGAMAGAIKKISVARGHDVTRYVLQCFGGAGGQHACRVADALGIQRIYVHPLAGVLSAYGMGLADQSVSREASVEQRLDDHGLAAARAALDSLTEAAVQELQRQGAAAATIHTRRHLHLRYDGTDTALPVPDAPLADLHAAFNAAYRQRYAHAMDRALVVDTVSVEAVSAAAPTHVIPTTALSSGPAPTLGAVRVYTGGQWCDTALVQRDDAQPGQHVAGPAVIVERNATTVVEPGWQARVTAFNHLLIERQAPRTSVHTADTHADPVLLEVFNNLYMNIAEQMGQQLQNTAQSVNIKERLDFSCALFDAHGNLIANAPHMPVHLGSMSESIKTVIARNAGTMRPGDVYALNDPYHGGTHLPDITVVTPIYLNDADSTPAFYVGSRGHHADIGGMTPGSMPPNSTRIEEEGVQLDNFRLVAGQPNGSAQLRESELLALLASGLYPARNPQQNLADLRAQIAANQKGAQELRRMVDEHGLPVVVAYMQRVQDNAEAAVRRAIGALRDGACTLQLDNGARICVAVRVDAAARSAVIDFTGTSEQQTNNNFNAPTAVCMAAVLYVFRTLVDDDIPLNAGCLKPLQVLIPEGSMLNPRPPASVVAGNVETSMCITNALYGALGLMASSQCTMNNLTFGNARVQYYETIAGGSGAGPGFDGTAAVQTHMTNSRLTDPEVLELRYPVRLDSFALRSGSGGAGQNRGGDGAVRRIRFLEAMTVAILSNGRTQPAFGMAGGAPGALGRNRIERADGSAEALGATATAHVQPGDAIVIETPGGGGWGAAPRQGTSIAAHLIWRPQATQRQETAMSHADRRLPMHRAAVWGVLGAALSLAGCVTQQIEGAWKDPQAPANALRGARVLVVCDAYEPLAQRLCEERMAEAVTAQGATPILYSQSGNALPAERQPGDAQYLPAARVTAATAVLATSVTMVATDYYGPASGMSIGIGGFSYGRSSGGGVGLSMPIGGYGGGMATGYSMSSRITDTASGRLLWTAKASATPSSDVDSQLSELARSVVAEATRAGMF